MLNQYYQENRGDRSHPFEQQHNFFNGEQQQQQQQLQQHQQQSQHPSMLWGMPPLPPWANISHSNAHNIHSFFPPPPHQNMMGGGGKSHSLGGVASKNSDSGTPSASSASTSSSSSPNLQNNGFQPSAWATGKKTYSFLNKSECIIMLNHRRASFQ